MTETESERIEANRIQDVPSAKDRSINRSKVNSIYSSISPLDRRNCVPASKLFHHSPLCHTHICMHSTRTFSFLNLCMRNSESLSKRESLDRSAWFPCNLFYVYFRESLTLEKSRRSIRAPNAGSGILGTSTSILK
jgi:hypothetical protein